jgi:antitoxin component YwqK of YwqJK toxin-antitoxin module
MSTRKKIVLGIFAVIIIAIISFIAYIYFSEAKNRSPFTAIPDDAIYIIETNDLTKGWATISDSKMWKHMRTNKHFEDISKSAASLDSLIKGNATMDMLFSDRQMLISAHMISGNDYDFIFVVNMTSASKIVFLKDYISSIVGAFGYSLSTRNFEGSEIMELTDDKTLEVLYISFIDNLFVGSYSPILIEKSIKQKDKNNWTKNKSFQDVAGEISSSKLFNFYFNYNMLSKFMGVYLSEESDMVNSLGSSLKFTAFNVNFEDERLSFSGYTNLADSVSSYLKALSTIDPGKADGYKLVSENAALYFSMCFDDFNDFYKNLTTELSNEKGAQYEDYSKTVKKVEKLFKIDLEKDFFSWIGNEIAFVKMKPVVNAKENDVSILINTKDIDDAKAGMEHLTKQVKKRSPLKFDTVNYKGYCINYLDIKGFFKLFFGKLLGKLEKPYFTYMDDYVVFSNSSSALMDMIDDYQKGRTLEKNEAFVKFKENFESKSNVTVFVRMPEMYSHLYLYSNNEKRKGVHDNKDLILSFSEVGFQLVSDGKLLKTTLIIEHDEDALFNQELEKFENAAEDLYFGEFDSLKFKPVLSAVQLAKEGHFEIKDDSGKVKSEGTVSDGKIEGVVKSFYESGNLKSRVNYRDGKAAGKATFYYDSDEQKVKAEMVFDEDEQIKGEYVEYYENGARKAVLEFEDNKPNGDATFYYDSGIVKIEGSYKDGVKNGKWKNYTEDGNILDKAKWKKGRAKKGD